MSKQKKSVHLPSPASNSTNTKDENPKSTIKKNREIDVITFVYPMQNGKTKEFIFESMFDNYSNNDRETSIKPSIVNESLDDILQMKNNEKKNRLECNDKSKTKETTQSSSSDETNDTTTASTKDTNNKPNKEKIKITKVNEKSMNRKHQHTIEVNLTNLQKIRQFKRKNEHTNKKRNCKNNSHLLGNHLVISTWDDEDDNDDAKDVKNEKQKVSREIITKDVVTKERKKRKGMYLDKWDSALDLGKTKKVKSKTTKNAYSLDNRDAFQQLQTCLQKKSKKGI